MIGTSDAGQHRQYGVVPASWLSPQLRRGHRREWHTGVTSTTFCRSDDPKRLGRCTVVSGCRTRGVLGQPGPTAVPAYVYAHKGGSTLAASIWGSSHPRSRPPPSVPRAPRSPFGLGTTTRKTSHPTSRVRDRDAPCICSQPCRPYPHRPDVDQEQSLADLKGHTPARGTGRPPDATAGPPVTTAPLTTTSPRHFRSTTQAEKPTHHSRE